MAATPKFKVYDKDRKYQGSLKNIAYAAAVIVILGDGATIRLGHRQVLWTEGEELLAASESYNYVTEVAVSRMASLDLLEDD